MARLAQIQITRFRVFLWSLPEVDRRFSANGGGVLASLRTAAAPLPGAGKANSLVSFLNEKMEAKIRGHNEE